jgi:hypothetical protein
METNKLIIDKINEFLANTTVNKFEETIKQPLLDEFIKEVSDYFYSLLTIDVTERNRKFTFKNKYTKYYFEFGVSCIENGIYYDLLDSILHYLSNILNKNNLLSCQESLEIKLLEKLLIIIQKADTKEYLIIINYLCSPDVYYEISSKLTQVKKNDQRQECR